MAEAEHRFQAAHAAWRAARAETEKLNTVRSEEYDHQVAGWETAKASWLKNQEERNAAIDNKRATYLRCEPPAVVEYCEMVLNASEYPETFPSGFELDYIAETRMLVLDYSLPAVEALPKFKAHRYVATRDEIQPVAVADSWLNKTYDSVLYQIALRTMYELFQSDEAQALDAVVFNGWVNSIDKATGKEVNACVLTIQANKPEFFGISLGQVDPKACFKKLKGISASKLTAISPVRPILQLNKEDKRFIQPQNVMEHLDDSANLAAMDWEDFEHLIRQVFEKEFSSEGGEAKITQASRDGSVDAVVFDPDPLRGGKIIIQAKRYTNTVGVSAVRDLYGTILNEGANKGILVTTANYGPDAYEFAKDKPITLLSGNELLKETWNKAETDAEVTYSDHESAFKITGLHYHSEDLWDSNLGRVVHRSRVLDWHKHESWPEGYNNTDEIIQDMVSRCQGQKEACLSFLGKLREHVHAALVHGMPGRYWPNILNNNHWQDVANLIKLCVEEPDETALLIDRWNQLPRAQAAQVASVARTSAV